jgi:hypothetical protein
MSNDNEAKTFSLSEHETNLLSFVQNHQQAIFSGLLSTIAMDRLAVKVTDHTQFELSSDFKKITISEKPEQTAEEETVVKAAK